MSGSNNKKKAMAAGSPDAYPLPTAFIEWLESGLGRAAYFHKVDHLLMPVLLSKIKRGLIPITFEYACRLERAQKPSNAPFRAVDIMTFDEDRDLYRYVTGQVPAPAPLVLTPKPPGRKPKDIEQAVGA